MLGRDITSGQLEKECIGRTVILLTAGVECERTVGLVGGDRERLFARNSRNDILVNSIK